MERSPDHHGSRAADQIRAFNHASITTGDGWQYPAHAYRAIGQLAHLAHMLPQAIEQASLPVDRTHRDGRLLIDGGGNPGDTLTQLRDELAVAVHTARLLAAELDLAHATSASMGLDTRGLPEFEENA